MQRVGCRKELDLLQKARFFFEEMLHLGRSIRLGDRAAPSPRAKVGMLESRVLFSATPIAVLPDSVVPQNCLDGECDAISSSGDQRLEDAQQQSVRTTQSRTEIAIVDASVVNYDQLIDDLAANGDSERDFIVYLLDAEKDGVEQVSGILKGHAELDAIHLVSHGSNGRVSLGNTWLGNSNLGARAGEIASWSDSLSTDADLLIYGCELASTDAGKELVESISALTGADVAASVDDTGHVRYGGDWELEFDVGDVTTSVAFSDTVQASWQGLLAVGAYESFDYGPGILNGNSGGFGWASAWANTGGTPASVVADDLVDPTGMLPTAGGKAEMDTNFIFSQSRNLDTAIGTDGTTAWVSFLLEVDTLIGGFSIELGDTAGPNNTVTLGTTGNDFIVTRDRSTSGASTIDDVLIDGQTYFLVARIDFASGNDTVTFYVDPTPGEVSPDSPGSLTAQLTTADLGVFTEVGIVGAGNFGSNNSAIDEIRIGETFADVAPSASRRSSP